MLDGVIKLIIGDLEGKKEYKQLKKRIDALPKDYRYAFRKIQHYVYNVGAGTGDMATFADWTESANSLVDFFQSSAAQGKQVLDVIGDDVDKFCDDFVLASTTNKGALREKLNKEIMEKLNREEK